MRAALLINPRQCKATPHDGASPKQLHGFDLKRSANDGTYTLGAIADGYSNEVETNETNNALAGTQITVTAPDLVMTSLSTASTNIAVGTTFTISDTMTNQGNAPTTTACKNVYYFLSTDNVITTADRYLGLRSNCTAIAAGASDTVAATSLTIPTNMATGTYYLGAIADATNVLVESNKTNNTLAGPAIAIGLTPSAPVNVVASGGDASATVTFRPANGGAWAVTGYTVTSTPAGGVDSNAGSTTLSHVVTGLSNGTAYTFTVKATNAMGTGVASTASNSITPATILPPDAPANVSASGGDSKATISFTAPANTGGAPILGYTAIASPGSLAATCAASPCIVTGLSNGTAYTFTVKAGNRVGNSIASAPSNSVTPTQVLPDAPTNVVAAGGSIATVTFVPATTGGTGITGYTVTSHPAGGVDSNAGSTGLSHAITGLTQGVTYTFTVTATNGTGTSAPSTPSNSVTMMGGTQGAYYIHADHLDTPRQITDTSGNVVWEWQNSDPFGNNMPNENPSGQGTFKQSLRYPGTVADPETGLFYNTFRDALDPAIGAYKQSDPIGLYGGSPSVYVYVGGNPLSYTDSSGLCPMCLIPAFPYIPELLIIGSTWWATQHSSPVYHSDSGDDVTPPAPPRGLPPEGITPPIPEGGQCKPGPASRPSERDKGGQSLWDPDGGEWRWFPGDKWHNPHWDHNPHDRPSSPWINVPHGGLPPVRQQ